MVTGGVASSTIGTVVISYQYEGNPTALAMSYIATDYSQPGTRTNDFI